MSQLKRVLSPGINSGSMKFTRKELYNILRNSGHDNIENQFDYLKEEVKKGLKCPAENVKGLSKILTRFKSQFRSH